MDDSDAEIIAAIRDAIWRQWARKHTTLTDEEIDNAEWVPSDSTKWIDPRKDVTDG